MEKYSFLAHTADVGLEVYGATLEQLFANAAEGMFSYLSDLAPRPDSFRRSVTVDGIDTESLLVNWLSELLYISATEKAVLASFTLHHIEPTHLKAEVKGRTLWPGETLQHEIKAVTYHDLSIKKTRAGFTARIIFDI